MILHESVAHGGVGLAAEGLAESLSRIRSLLQAKADSSGGTVDSRPAAAAADRCATLRSLCGCFGLSDFERDVLVLCAGMELDSQFPALCAAAQDDDRLAYPTFRLALEVLPEAHWDALLPASALRRWRLLEVAPGEGLTASRLRIEESVLHYLMGMHTLDHRIQGLLEFIEPPGALAASYRSQVEKLCALLANHRTGNVVAQLEGSALRSKRSLAAAAAKAMGLSLYALRVSGLAYTPAEQEELIHIWQRESVLNGCALLLDVEHGGPAEWTTAALLADRIEGVLLVAGSGRLELSRKNLVRLHIDRPKTAEQQALWRYALGEHSASLNGQLNRLAAQFALDPESILEHGRRAATAVAEGGDLIALLWEACRSDSRPSLDGRAQRVPARARWDDIVLPEQSMCLLRAVSTHVRQQEKVFEEWGFSAQSIRGLGTTALFTGPSGTGKTLAAEVLANELCLDLYRIDLSQVISKYIGETEKNLCSIFDAAESSGAILLFDEADALFGKRSEVKDSHDRYANIEVSYLLQRMESYRGLAILTTNMRTALDAAFLRRISFIVSFPFPDPSLRRRIWERVFPSQTPTTGIDPEKLARLNLAGGNIRNIALNAAFMAADAGKPVCMEHLLVAARQECSKLEKPLSDAEIGGWV